MTAMQRNKGASLHLSLPLPPTSNTMFANRKGGGRQKTKKYMAWRRDAYEAAIGQLSGWQVCSGPVSVDITCKRPRKNADIDNRIKPVLDLLQTVYVLTDDKNVMEVRARWGDVEGAEINITPWTEEGLKA